MVTIYEIKAEKRVVYDYAEDDGAALASLREKFYKIQFDNDGRAWLAKDRHSGREFRIENEGERRRRNLVRMIDLIQRARKLAEQCRDEDQKRFDGMLEFLQNGEKGERARDAIESMGNAIQKMEELERELGGA